MDLKVGDAIPNKIKDWHSADRKHATDWRREAREDYDFVAGKQYTDEEEQSLKEQMRPVVVFNRASPLVDAVLGAEMGNRKEVRYLPREEGDSKKDEVLTSAAEWFRDRTDAEMEESEMFRDATICGMGWTETRLDYEENPDGDPSIKRISPFEMLWDYRARSRNLVDAERIWHIKKFPLSAATALFPQFSPLELHAEWATFEDKDGKSAHITKPVIDRMAGATGENDELTEVTLVRVQWIERQTFYRYSDPEDGETQSLPEAEYEKANAILSSKGGEGLKGVKQVRKVRKQAFLGNVILAAGNTACPTHFNFECCTGKLDLNKGTFYGLVKGMKDPQRWANKFFSQTMHILNTGAKGGIIAERTMFENWADAERDWARPEGITAAAPGSLSGQNPKWAAKPQFQLPPGMQYLIEFSANSIRDVSGVNQELLGNREADQPGVLEYQRKQAALTVLQWLFDALKTYRKRQGGLMLYYIQNDLSDGRLVKIIGDSQAQYVKLAKEQFADKEYDIIVDDMPTSPNHKEAVFSMMMNMPKIFQDMITPQVAAVLLEYSPFPSAVVEKIKKAGEQAAQSPQAQMADRMMAVEIELTEMKAFLAKAQGMKAMAEAETAGNEANDPMLEAQVQREKNQGDLAVAQTKVEGQLQIQQAKAAGDMQIKGMEAQANIGLQRQQAEQSASLQERQFQSEDRRANQQMSVDADLRRQEIKSGAQTKVKTATIAAKAKPKPKAKGD